LGLLLFCRPGDQRSHVPAPYATQRRLMLNLVAVGPRKMRQASSQLEGTIGYPLCPQILCKWFNSGKERRLSSAFRVSRYASCYSLIMYHQMSLRNFHQPFGLMGRARDEAFFNKDFGASRVPRKVRPLAGSLKRAHSGDESQATKTT
jgi:hypothetical protein